MQRFSPAFFLWLIIFPFAAPLQSQQTCPPPPIPVAARPPGILTVEQEQAIGEAVAAQLERDYLVIEDELVVDYLRRVGGRLAERIPNPAFEFEFRLVDLPVVNAFALPGGRIYVTRKLIAITRNEDEVAGVLAHEMGHVVTHEIAERWASIFREVLNVTDFGDRENVVELYHQVIENARRNRKAFRQSHRERQQGQFDADTIALYIMANAGYAPQAYVDLWDRFNETKGKTGNWFSDMFGGTKPESRRLREMLKAGKELPAQCLPPVPSKANAAYDQWKLAVVAYSGLGRKQFIPGLMASTTLDPPLQADMHSLRFSPDGRYLVAQNDASIYVLSVRPFQTLFRIDAPEAYPAKFVQDSQSIVFHNSGLRVETWSIPEQQRTDVQELAIREMCLQTELSFDGKTLSCLTANFDLLLKDVESGETLYQKNSFFVPTLSQMLMILIYRILDTPVSYVEMKFSPDSHYFLASGSTVAGFDLEKRVQLSIPGPAKRMLEKNFVFLGPDRLFGVRGNKGEKSALVQFPSGQVIKEIPIGTAMPASSADGDFVVVRPIEKYPVGIVSLETGQIILAHEKPAMDIHKDLYVKEARSGELVLYGVETRQMVQATALPQGPLGRIRAAALSDDAQWLAISERGRGGVWNLMNGRRYYHTRGFRGAFFHRKERALYADFPTFEQQDRAIARLDLGRTDVNPKVKLDSADATQYGPYLLLRKPEKKGSRSENLSIEIREADTDRVLWSEAFPKEAPDVYFQWELDTIVFMWGVSQRTAKDEIKQDAVLQERAKALREKEGDYYLRVVDAKTGRTMGRLLVETGKGSFSITDVVALEDTLVIADSEHRVLVYSLTTGRQKARTFGSSPVLARNGEWFAIEAGRGQLAVYKLDSMSKHCVFVFPHELSLVQFGLDGKHIYVLADNQTFYSIDLNSAAASKANSGSPAP